MDLDLYKLGVIQSANAVARGEVSSEKLTQVLLNRLAVHGPRLNCVVAIDDQAALEAARQADLKRMAGQPLGPLHGVPMAHKELFYRQGRKTSDGSLITKDHVPVITSTALKRLDDAGAIDMGLLHMAEFAMSPTGYNLHHGHALNPWDLERCPGGSSSGSGAAVAARLTPASLGTDTGGSIRHPAAMCGVTGLKPTWSRVSAFGVMPLSRSLDCIGPLARSARDCAKIFAIIAGHDPLDPLSSHEPVVDVEHIFDADLRGFKMAVPTGDCEQYISDEMRVCLNKALESFKDLGVTLVRTPGCDMALIHQMLSTVLTVEAATHHKDWMKKRPQDYSEQVLARIKPGLSFSGVDYCEALQHRSKWREHWLSSNMGDADCVFLPSLPGPAPTVAETTQGHWPEISEQIKMITHNTRGINYLGLPALSVPCGFVQNLPVAFQLLGRAFDEAALLRAADAYQKVTGWHLQSPVGF
jgi:aspartyl-tRNA(Asn)/glutamyl-tRNA(Gln) amidotransferase subunit A